MRLWPLLAVGRVFRQHRVDLILRQNGHAAGAKAHDEAIAAASGEDVADVAAAEAADSK